jgi:predicted MFS family arabinose efflux permease
MATLTGFGAIRGALKNPNYRAFAAGASVSNIGTWVQRVATGWLAWELTHSGFWLGVVAFADLFPMVVLSSIAGAVVDRIEPLRMLITAQTLSMLQAIVLMTLTLSGLMTIELLTLLSFIYGSIIAFNQPARLTVVPQLVERADLSAAIGINSLIFNVARMVGPAVSGVIIVAWGVAPAFGFNAVGYLVMLFVLTRLDLPSLRQSGPPRPLSELPREIASGYRYVIAHPGIGPLLFMQIVVSVCARPYVELFPGFAEQVFGRGPEALAWLTSATGAGAMVGGMWLAGRGRLSGLTAISVSSALIFGVSLLGFAATDEFVVALGCTVVAGFAMVIAGVAQQTLIQAGVEAAMRGRVVALFGMVVRGSPALGALAMGAASEYVGLRWPVAVGAIICLIVWLWSLRRQPRIAEAVEKE